MSKVIRPTDRRGILHLGLTRLAHTHPYHAEVLNRWVIGLVRAYSAPIGAFKNDVLYFVMLPLRIGLIGAITPYSWGFALTPGVIGGYVAGLLAVAAWLAFRFGWRPALALLVCGLFFYYGFAGFPWPAFMAMTVAHIYGHTSDTADLKTDLYLIMAGDSAKEALKRLGIAAGTTITRRRSAALRRDPPCPAGARCFRA